MRKGLIVVLILLLTGCTSITTKTQPTIPYTRLQEANDTITVTSNYYPKPCYLVVGDQEFKMKVVESGVDNFTVGEYLQIYEYMYQEQTYTCQRMVFVVDDVPPVVSLNKGIDTLNRNDIHEDNGVSITDNYSESFDVEVVSNVDTSVAGTYTIVYTVYDEYQNKTEVTRYVTVIE